MPVAGELVAGVPAAGRQLLVTTMPADRHTCDADLAGPDGDRGRQRGARRATELVDAADELITIAMAGPTESLNVAMAATVLLFEARRHDVARTGMNSRGPRPPVGQNGADGPSIPEQAAAIVAEAARAARRRHDRRRGQGARHRVPGQGVRARPR